MTGKMAARNRKAYWAARAVQREQEDYLKGSELSAKLFSQYERAAVALRKDMNDFYGKYATRHGLTYDQAVRTLTRQEAMEWKASLREYVEQIGAATDPKVKAAMVAQLDALSANSQISRLEALLGQTQLTLNGLYDRCVSELRAELGDIYEAGYYRKHYDLQSRAGWINEIAKLDTGMVESAINYPWSGAMFSDRLWRNKDALLFHVREILTQGLIQGKGLPETAKALSTKLGQAYKAAERLVRTETSHLHNEADKAAYLEAGVEEYEFVATLDARTCEVCGALDGRHFKLSVAVPGENYPPMHPNDRCTTVEYDPEDEADWAASGERMPEGMTYGEWIGRQGVDRDGDLSDNLRRAAKSVAARGRVVDFDGLPEDCKEAFRAGLSRAAPEAKELLRREYRKADYVVSKGKHSYYRGLEDVVEVGQNAQPSTLAHELFHRLDRNGSTSKALMPGLTQDYVALNVVGGGDIKEYLVRRYPAAFVQDRLSTDTLFQKEYRGISDILNGLSVGKTDFGFGHRPTYWAEAGTLEAEAWAQFGRIQFENKPEVLKMLSDLFPNLEKSAMLALKGLI